MKVKAKAYFCLASVAIALSALAGNEANPDALELAPLPMPVEYPDSVPGGSEELLLGQQQECLPALVQRRRRRESPCRLLFPLLLPSYVL